MDTARTTKRTMFIVLAIIASIGGAASAFAGDGVAGAQPKSLVDDPSYQSYLRWNGLDAGDKTTARVVPAPSYDSYLEWNGFTVSKPTTGQDISAPSNATYDRWNGFDSM